MRYRVSNFQFKMDAVQIGCVLAIRYQRRVFNVGEGINNA